VVVDRKLMCFNSHQNAIEIGLPFALDRASVAMYSNISIIASLSSAGILDVAMLEKSDEYSWQITEIWYFLGYSTAYSASLHTDISSEYAVATIGGIKGRSFFFMRYPATADWKYVDIWSDLGDQKAAAVLNSTLITTNTSTLTSNAVVIVYDIRTIASVEVDSAYDTTQSLW
jgi:hypothetical protein